MNERKTCKYNCGLYSCNRSCYNQTDYCIFHTFSEDKNDSEFQLFLRKEIDAIYRTRETIFNLTGTHFAGDCSGALSLISNLDIEKIDFRECTFSSKLDLSHTEFPSVTDFGYCVFESDVNFAQSKFGCTSKDTVSKGYVSFVKCEFKGRCTFLEAVFEVNAQFQDTDFGFSNFVGACFHHGAMFNNSVFRKHTDFTNVVFKEDAGFYGTKHLSTTKLSGIEVHGMLNIKRIVIGDESSDGQDIQNFVATDARIHGSLLGMQIKAHGNFIANYSEFLGTVNLSGSEFYSKLSFLGAFFKGNIILRNCIMQELDMTCTSGENQFGLSGISAASDSLVLRGIITNNDTWVAQIYKNSTRYSSYYIIFDACTFNGPVRIRDSINSIGIRDCTFTSYLYVVSRNFEENNSLFYNMDIVRTAFIGPTCFIKPIIHSFTYNNVTGEFQLYRAKLEKASFRGTNLSTINFNEVTWPCMKRRGISGNTKRQKCIADEPILIARDAVDYSVENSQYEQPKPESYQHNDHNVIGEIRNQYNQIHKNYENRNRYGLASPFKIAEYSLREGSKSTHASEKTILHLYRVLSTYGTSIFKPLLWIIGVLIIPPIIVTAAIYFAALCFSSEINTIGFIWDYVTATFQELFKPQLAYPFNIGILLGNNSIHTFLYAIQKIVIYILWIQIVFAIRERIRR